MLFLWAVVLRRSVHDFYIQLPHQSYLCSISALLQLCAFASGFETAATQKMSDGVMVCLFFFSWCIIPFSAFFLFCSKLTHHVCTAMMKLLIICCVQVLPVGGTCFLDAICFSFFFQLVCPACLFCPVALF